MEAIIITDWDTDYSQHLFIDGKLALSGDWYHDKIDALIEGYILGIESLKGPIGTKSLDLDEDGTSRALYTEEDGKEVLICKMVDDTSVLAVLETDRSSVLGLYSPEELEDAITMGVLRPIED